jgi:hypothetical protein
MDEERDLPFELNDDGSFMFKDGFIITDEIVDASGYVFETPLLKPYVSKFTNAKNKNITLANVFKLCVLLDCSPNDLFNWEDWSDRVKGSDSKVSNDEIKKMI